MLTVLVVLIVMGLVWLVINLLAALEDAAANRATIWENMKAQPLVTIVFYSAFIGGWAFVIWVAT